MVTQLNRLTRPVDDLVVERSPNAFGDYSLGLRDPDNSAADDTPQEAAITKLRDFEERFAESLLKETWFASALPGASPQSLASHYLQDVAALEKQLADFNTFTWAITDNHITMFAPISPIPNDRDSTILNAILAQGRSAFLDEIVNARIGVMGQSILNARLMAGTIGELFTACKGDILLKVQALAHHVVRHLTQGVRKGLYGVCVWTGPSTCWYVRNEFHLRVKNAVVNRNAINRATVNHTHDRWVVGNEVNLMDAEILLSTPKWLDWPAPIWKAVEQTPRFLCPSIKTVVGTMIHKRQFTWFMGSRDLSKDVPLPQEEPILDPAVTIGPVVLTGYERELHRTPSWWRRLKRVFDTR